jgi:hypothetical protein
VDDDDRVSPNYVQRILPLLQPGDVDYVGWRMQAYIDGQPLKPTYHSLKFNGWWENQEGYYRHISHLNPIRRRLALEESFRSPHFPEDVGWALRLAAKNVVKTEAYIGDEPMYHYYSSTTSSLGQSPERVRPGNYVRPVIDSPYFRYHWKSSDGYTG